MHLVDTTLFFAPHSGGVKRYLLAKHAFFRARRGVRHTLVVPGAHTHRATDATVTVRSLRLPHPAGYRVPIGTRVWSNVLCELAPDLIEAGDPYHGAWAALRASDTLGVAAVAFAHSDVATLVGSHAGRFAGRVAGAYIRRLYRQFDLVVAPSRTAANSLHAAGVDRVALVPLGIDDSVFHPLRRDPSLRQELGLGPSARLLVFAGRMGHEKRIGTLLDAVDALGAPYHLLLVGGSRAERISPTATVLPYEHDPRRLARVLASADAFVHAGLQETFGLVVIEAMACGIPVVAVRSGALAELVDASVGMLAHDPTSGALAEAIGALFDRDTTSLGDAARNRAMRYGWGRTFGMLFEHYVRLAPTAALRAAALPSLRSSA